MNYSDPATWDDLWEHNTPDDLLARLLNNREANPVWHARYVHALGAAKRLAEATNHLDAVMGMYEGKPGVNLDLLRAIRLQVLLGLGEYREAIDGAQEIRSTAPLSLEAGCYTHYALAFSHLYLGDKHLALYHVGQSMSLATALDLPHRRRVTQMLWTHILHAMGRTVPKQVLEDIAGSRHRPTAEYGAVRVIESHMYAGEYHVALRHANQYGVDWAVRLCRAFMLDFSDEPLEPKWVMQVIDGLRAASELRFSEIPQLDTNHLPISSYALFLNALRALHARDTTNFENKLGDMPGHPDQRVYWHGLRLLAALDGLIDTNPAQASLDMIEALIALPYKGHVVRLLEAFAPRLVLLLSHAPDSRLRPLFNGVATPLLLDTHVTNHANVRVPPQAAARLIHQGVGVPMVVNGGHISKYRDRLKKHNLEERRIVTIGELYVDAEKIQQAAADGLAEAWDGVLVRLRRASPQLTTALLSRIRD